MLKKLFAFLLILTLISAGCRNRAGQTNGPSPQVNTKPLLTSWEIEGNPAITQSGFTFAINGFYLYDGEIILFYSLTGTNAERLISEIRVQVIDENGDASNLREIAAFAHIDGIEIGKMQFTPRRTGIQDLYLSITDRLNPQINQQVAFAQLFGSKDDDRLDRIFYGEPVNGVELNGYQISILWSAAPGNLSGELSLETSTASNTQANSSQPTPTIVVRQPAVTIPPDVNIQSEITFQVKNTTSGNIQFIEIQLLSDGNSIISTNGKASLVTPMVLTTPTPVNTRYPPPTLPYP